MLAEEIELLWASPCVYSQVPKMEENLSNNILIHGSLMYVANRSHPDIAYAVGRLSRYTSNPS